LEYRLPWRAELVHGKGYLSWEEWNQLDIVELLKPRPGDIVVYSTEQFDKWLRENNINNLVYTGFTTNLCILDSPAAMRVMSKLGYTIVILREATLAIEHHDTLSNLLNTKLTIRYIETWVGFSASVDDFIKACESLLG